jgi:hypothetical protein
MDRSLYDSRLKNLHSWSGHLESTIEEAVPRACAELGPPGEETAQDARDAAEALTAVAKGLDEVMGAYDLLLEAVGRPRRYDDFLQSLVDVPAPAAGRAGAPSGDAPGYEISRTQFARLVSELHYDAGWLSGAIHGAMVCGGDGNVDGHLDGLATGIEELMVSYDHLQDLIGVMPARHSAFLDRHMVVLEE